MNFDNVKPVGSNQTFQTPFTIPSNGVAKALSFIGWATMVVGFIVGVAIIVTLKQQDSDFTYAVVKEPHQFRWVYGISCFISSVISGVLFLGIAEIIKLLHSMWYKQFKS